MQSVFSRISRVTAVVALLVALIVPAAYAEDGAPDPTLGARINPPIGVAEVDELDWFELFVMWAETGMLTPVW
jgi:hypothetical protein